MAVGADKRDQAVSQRGKKEEGRRGMRAADGLHARGRKLGRGWAGWLGFLARAALSIFIFLTKHLPFSKNRKHHNF